jgi:acetate---CoA ligase (ADP-forming)
VVNASTNAALAGTELVELLSAPASIAIVGASSDLTSTSGRPLAHLLRYGYPGRIVPINPKRDEVGGVPAFASVSEIEPGSIDVAMVLLAARLAPAAVEELASVGVKATITIASGVDAEGRQRLERVAESGMRIIGPNCLGGFATASSSFLITSSVVGRRRPATGSIALVMQSGAMGNLTMISLLDRSVGISHLISTGDEVDVSGLELVTGLLYRPEVSVVGMFMEGLGRLDWLAALAAAIEETGKQVIVLKAARTDAGRLAASGHTGRVVGSADVSLAVMREAGIEIVDSMGALADALVASSVLGPLPGRRVAIASVSGGAGVLAADALRSSENLEVAEFSADPALQARLGGRVTELQNPLDMPVWDTLEFAGWANAVATSPHVDAVVVAEAGFMTDETVLSQEIANYAERRAPTIIVPLAETSVLPEGVVQRLAECGVAVMPSVERAISALDVVAGRRPEEPDGSAPTPHDHETDVLGLEELARVLGDGWPWAEYVVTSDLGEATSAAREIGFPVVVKAAGRTLHHRSDTGAVSVGVTEGRLPTEFNRILALAAASGDEVMVQQQVDKCSEVMVSGFLDPETGPVAIVRPGGTLTELVSKQAIVWGGWSPEARRRHINDSIVGTLLGGYRDTRAGDLPRLADLVDRVLAALKDNKVTFIEFNPVLVGATGIVLVDALGRVPGRAQGEPEDGATAGAAAAATADV